MKPLYKNRYVIAAVVIVILLGGGATFILNRLLDLDSYRDQILSQVQKALNRQVLYEKGTFILRFGPEFVFTHVIVREKDGSADFIRADRLKIRIALLPLLEKRLVLSSIDLEKPVIQLSRDQGGVFNFSDLLETKPRGTPLHFRGIRIRKGEIHYRDMAVAPQGVTTILKDTDFYVHHLGRGKRGNFKLSTTIVQKGKPGSVVLSGSVKLAAKERPLRESFINVEVSTMDLDASPFWPYYSRYVPFRKVMGRLDMDGRFKGKLAEFNSNGKVRISGLRFDYPEVFHAVLLPRDLRFSYDMSLDPVDIMVKSLNLTVDGLNVKGSCAIRDITSGDPRITARATTSRFNLENFGQYIPYGIIVKDTADYIEQHIKGGIYRLDDGRLDGRVSQIAHMERGTNYNVLFINGRVEQGLVSYGPDNPTFNNIRGTLELRGKDFILRKMSGSFGGSQFKLDGKITDYPVTTPCEYPFTMSITPRQPELAWLLGKEKGPRLAFNGESTLHLSGFGTTDSYNLSGDWNLTPTAYSYPDLIIKPAGRANSLSFRGNVNKQEMKVSFSQYNLAPMALNIGASCRFADKGGVALDIRSNQFQVNDVAAMFPPVKKYQTAGTVQAALQAKSPGEGMAGLHWGGNIHLSGFSFNPGEGIKSVSNVNGVVNFNGDTMETSQISAHIGNTAITCRGSLAGFANPALSLVFYSPSLDPADFGIHTPRQDLRLARVQGNISLQDKTLQIKSFSTQLNRSVVNLKGTIRDMGNPVADLTLTSPYLEVEDLLLAGSMEWIKKKGDSSAPPSITLSLQVDAGKSWWGIGFEKLHGTLIYENGILYLQPLTCSAMGGDISGKVRIDSGSDNAPHYQLSYSLNNVSAESFVRAMGVTKQEITGRMTMQGELSAKGKTSEEMKKTLLGSTKVHFEEGKLRQFAVLSKIFSLLNLSQLLKFQLPDMVSGGMPYNKISATLAIKDGVISSNDLYISGDALNISAVGKVDLVRDELDATIGVKPLQTVDKVLSHLPVVGWILTGKNKSLITAYFEAKGKLGDPQVKAVPVQSMAKGVFNIFKRVFQLPATLFTDTGAVIINK